MRGHHPIQTSWVGFYKDERVSDEKTDMKFASLIIDNGNIRGSGEDSVGKFELNGTKVSNKITFAKHYIEMHTVIYTGKLSDTVDGQEVQGEWYLKDYPDVRGTFTLTRSLELERKRDAAFQMVVARMKMMVGFIRFFFEDIGFAIVQVMFLMEAHSSQRIFNFTVLSLAAGLFVSLAGPLAEYLASRKLEKEGGEAANPGPPPSVDGGHGGRRDVVNSRGPTNTSPDHLPKEAEMEELLQSNNYEERLKDSRTITNSEFLSGNVDYVEILMERPDVPAEVPDLAITDVIVSSSGVHRMLLLATISFWVFIILVPVCFDISCQDGIPAKAHLGFMCVTLFSWFVQVWVAILTKYGYLMLAHAPQRVGFNLLLSFLGCFDSYSDIAFVAAARDCGSCLWVPAAVLYFVGVILAQAVPGICMLALKVNIPAALKLNEMNVLLSLLKASNN